MHKGKRSERRRNLGRWRYRNGACRVSSRANSRFTAKLVVLVAAGTLNMMSLWLLALGAVRRGCASLVDRLPRSTPIKLHNSNTPSELGSHRLMASHI